jgi:mono/diheme cytochrome c family protein
MKKMINSTDMKTRSIYITALLLIMSSLPLSIWAQSDWQVSEDKQNEKNPTSFSEESIKTGKSIYAIRCQSCHGEPTKNNGLPLVPKPTDLSEQAFLDINTDGSIFHKLKEGRVTMPSFSTVLSDEEIWQVVNYIRSFDANAEAPIASVKSDLNIDGIVAPFSIDVVVDEANHQVKAKLLGTKDGEKVGLPNTEIFIGIKRYFGTLPIMETGATTNVMGELVVDYPQDLPSGEDGIGELVVYPVDQESFANLQETAELKLTTVEPVDWSKIRALWANNKHVPYWLLITYLSMVIIVWGVMFKVVLNIFKIKKLGS